MDCRAILGKRDTATSLLGALELEKLFPRKNSTVASLGEGIRASSYLGQRMMLLHDRTIVNRYLLPLVNASHCWLQRSNGSRACSSIVLDVPVRQHERLHDFFISRADSCLRRPDLPAVTTPCFIPTTRNLPSPASRGNPSLARRHPFCGRSGKVRAQSGRGASMPSKFALYG